MNAKHFLLAGPAILVMACQNPNAPTPGAAERPGSAQSVVAKAGGPPGTTGGGHLAIGALDVKFSFNAVRTGSGGAAGRLHYSTVLSGLPVEFFGRVTCVAVDTATRRAWVGGVITDNRSDPATGFQAARNQIGRDIWFRVVDNGEGAGAPPDRSTFVGFEGDRGIITSAEYCAARLWVDGDVGTNPVTRGNIQVEK